MRAASIVEAGDEGCQVYFGHRYKRFGEEEDRERERRFN